MTDSGRGTTGAAPVRGLHPAAPWSAAPGPGARRERSGFPVRWIGLVLLAFPAPTGLCIPAWGSAPRDPHATSLALKGHRIVHHQPGHMAALCTAPSGRGPLHLHTQGVATLCPGLLCGRAFSAQKPDHHLRRTGPPPPPREARRQVKGDVLVPGSVFQSPAEIIDRGEDLRLTHSTIFVSCRPPQHTITGLIRWPFSISHAQQKLFGKSSKQTTLSFLSISLSCR